MDDESTKQGLIDALLRHHLDDARLLEAFKAVPRHLFLPDLPLADIYSDSIVPIRFDPDGHATSLCIKPSMTARMLHQLRLKTGHNVLEIGTGTGFTAALINQMVGETGMVTTLEIDRDVAELARENLQRSGSSSVAVVNEDGAAGYAPRAAYDRILSSVGIWDMPAAWKRQIKPDGLIVAPIYLDGLQVSATFRQQPDGSLLGDRVMPSASIYIQGMAAGPSVRQRIGSTAMLIITDDVGKIDPAALSLLLSEDHSYDRLSITLNTSDYWYSFVPFLMLNEPDDAIFAVYTVPQQRQAYGVEGEGFALLTSGSACFVPYDANGMVHCFAGVDALLSLENQIKAWQAANQPPIDALRLHLIPKGADKPAITTGKIYPRRDHYLHVWIDHATRSD